MKLMPEETRQAVQAEQVGSEAQLRSFFEAAPQAILAVSSQGSIVLVNQRTEQMFGYTREELLGQNLELLLPERYRETHKRHRKSYFAEPRVRAMGTGMDLSGRRKDGSEFSIEIGLSYVKTDQGTLALGLVSDITERKRSADQLARVNADLRSREAQLRSYLEAASQAIVAVGSDGRIQLVNRRTEEIFGYARAELLGQELEMLLPDRYRVAHVMHRSGYFHEPRMRAMGQGMDLSGRRKDGTEFPLEIGLSFVETDEGTLALGLVSDITERKNAELEITRVNTELRRTNAELEQFVYVASHDLQEPLRTIATYLQLLERGYRDKLDRDGIDYLRYAVDGALRMKSLIQDLLQLSRAGTQPIKVRPVPSTALLETALLNLGAAIQQAHATVTQDPLPPVMADAGLLTQVFQNLIANAIKFHAKENLPAVHVSSRIRDAECEFSVRDNGIGIDAGHSERIFHLFERLHNADQYPGSGVGLAISQKIVERHGGRIRLESKVGQGSTFYFSIPMGGRQQRPETAGEESA
jgi:PAS domain S-box-containing protein